MQMFGLVLLGVAAGALSGLTGIGGGIIIVPALIYLFGYSAHLAQGTTLALLVPPIGILAAWAYYQKGFVDVPSAAIIAAGFIVGTLLGAKLSVGISDDALRKVFATLMVVVSIKMFKS
ncbi:MAG: sulfite exporter TauE/SafE family protein [Alphaproteobacteria bacterium]|nr:sulfite exporter TauE/SafE family protein [Alphaproteobacteria bacterium]